jgi:hypothetical protein
MYIYTVRGIKTKVTVRKLTMDDRRAYNVGRGFRLVTYISPLTNTITERVMHKSLVHTERIK